MTELKIDKKTIKELFSHKKADFLIPDYQRPYSWGVEECTTLWNDIFNFAIPGEEGNRDASKFDTNSEYFLGPIVTYSNQNKVSEIIDGQQRLTTIMLLLRAFYDKFIKMKDVNAQTTAKDLAQCIWKTDEFNEPLYGCLKINSEVASDNDKEEFVKILESGDAPKTMKSKYAENFRFFRVKVDEFINDYASYLRHLPNRIMNNCILLPIEANDQESALRIFSTLNDRGLPLSDADIFKAQFYKYYNEKGEKDDFIKKWKDLEEVTDRIFHPMTGTPMDELFTRYMYFERAKQGNRSSTTEGLRKFYEKDMYALLKRDETLENLIILAKFWDSVSKQDDSIFSDGVLRKLFVLNYAPNGMWNYFVSVYFMQNKDKDGKLDNSKFEKFLSKTIAFVWTYSISYPGVNALRTPVFSEMINIVNNKEVTFADYKMDRKKVFGDFDNYEFKNNRPITKSMLSWWAFENDNQALLSIDDVFEIEHIYAKNRYDKEKTLSDPKYVEEIGNKSLLEKRINIRASDYKFNDKKPYYKGYTNARGQFKDGTKVHELVEMAGSKTDFTEQDIMERTSEIINSFLKYVADEDLFI